MVRYELLLLNELGFGLDLSACVASGRSEDLAYVSPRSGGAVSRSEGEPYRDRLLALYQKGKDKQWDSVHRIDWDVEVEPADVLGLPVETGVIDGPPGLDAGRLTVAAGLAV